MPATSVKSLYLAKSVKDLDILVAKAPDIKTRPTAQLVTSAKNLLQAAEKCAVERDEEKAYTLFMRFIELILSLQKRDDFKKIPSYSSFMQQVNTALNKAESLKDSLKNRYPKITEEIKIKEKNDKNEISSLHSKKTNVSEVDDKVNIIKTPGPEDVPENSISTSKLVSLISTNQAGIVIMDVRSEKDFEQSHIKHSCCINVREEILTPGVTAATLEKLLPPESHEVWRKRSDADYVIIIDWNCKDALKPSLCVTTLKAAMCKWDQKCSLKKPPVILLGGYNEWMLKYPMLTTCALNVFASDKIAAPVITDVSGIEYPNLGENSAEKNNENFNGPGPLFKKSAPVTTLNNNISSSADSKKTIKSAPAFDRKSKPLINKPSSATQSKISSSVFENPLADKPTEKLLNGNQENAYLESLSEEELLAKDSRDIAQERLLKEQEFEKFCLRKEKEAEESKRIEIQKQEAIILEKLKELDLYSAEKDAECSRVKAENLRMKKLLDKIYDKEAQAKKEKEILMAEQEKKNLLEQVKRMREERKMKEAKKSFEPKPDASSRNAVSAGSAPRRTVQNDANSEYTVPLSRQSSGESGSRGLVRFHSSPDIANLVNQEEANARKMPSIDRSLKPKPPTTPTYLSEIRGARLRNLNPVYGNCPATGLRNLGNTCFMNSILQCLANTIPLVDYFMSNQYVSDIVRDNKHSMSGEVVEEFAVVLKTLWQGQYKSFSPKDFKNTVSKCLSVCIGNEQQDSHEFFVVLMEKLHSDLNRRAMRNTPKLDPDADETAFWKHHKSYNDSKVSEIFEGLLKSTLTCLSCRKTSNSFEAFSCLSLPISTSSCSLRDCFAQFLKPERISGEAAWDCPKCKQKKEAEKKLRISILPDILTIQLKRFSYEGPWRRKLQTHVDFDSSFDVPYEKNGEEYVRNYDLYGVVNHHGNLDGGHYIALCKSQSNKWYKYDDHEVSEISLSDIKTSAAYMLFYIANDIRSSL